MKDPLLQHKKRLCIDLILEDLNVCVHVCVHVCACVRGFVHACVLSFFFFFFLVVVFSFPPPPPNMTGISIFSLHIIFIFIAGELASAVAGNISLGQLL